MGEEAFGTKDVEDEQKKETKHIPLRSRVVGRAATAVTHRQKPSNIFHDAEKDSDDMVTILVFPE